MDKIKELKNIIENKDINTNVEVKLLDLFKDQIEKTTAWTHLILTKSQFDELDENFDFRVFGDILISVELDGEINFVHCFYIEDMESIKKEGLLISYSKKYPNYIPDMGYGIYVEEGDDAYEISNELASFLLNRYDEEDAEVGYVEGTYNGKYLECIYGYTHEGYIVLKNDVTLDMINNIDSEYISALASDYYNYEYMMGFDF